MYRMQVLHRSRLKPKGFNNKNIILLLFYYFVLEIFWKTNKFRLLGSPLTTAHAAATLHGLTCGLLYVSCAEEADTQDSNVQQEDRPVRVEQFVAEADKRSEEQDNSLEEEEADAGDGSCQAWEEHTLEHSDEGYEDDDDGAENTNSRCSTEVTDEDIIGESLTPLFNAQILRLNHSRPQVYHCQYTPRKQQWYDPSLLECE